MGQGGKNGGRFRKVIPKGARMPYAVYKWFSNLSGSVLIESGSTGGLFFRGLFQKLAFLIFWGGS